MEASHFIIVLLIVTILIQSQTPGGNVNNNPPNIQASDSSLFGTILFNGANHEYVANVYADLTDKDAQKAMKFLNYESNENEFCS